MDFREQLAGARRIASPEIMTWIHVIDVVISTSPPSPIPKSGSTSKQGPSVVLTIAQLCTTALIGVVGAIVSVIQVRNSRFKPGTLAVVEVDPDFEGNLKRIAIRISNKGGAAGMIRFIDIIDDAHDNVREVSYVGWDPNEPVPFYLLGRASAEIVIEPGPEDVFTRNDRIKIGYGLNKEETVKVKSKAITISGSCVLPPGSSPVSAPSPPGAIGRMMRWVKEYHS